ncbi:MAG: ABC transporter [Spirochaetes bacterium GWB1_36_13]|nr:MAG: ABC transporter [Spirochaetes bacterium GWB1_36_13]
MSEPAIQIQNVSKVYKLYSSPQDRLKEALHPFRKKYHKDFYALNDISFEVKKGETVGIIGQNGSGKSTLLKIITGVLSPTSGSVQVNGKISALLELGAGFNPEFTGLENVYFQGSLMGYTREEMEKKLDEILSFADIGDFIHQPVKTYSSGMFVRLAFAVAINVEPEILIVDEALSVGDVFFQLKCYRKINKMKDNNVTILLTTHDMSTIINYCNSAILLKKGILLSYGEPDKIIETYRKEESFQKININEIIERNTNNLYKNSYNINPNYIEYGNKAAEIIDWAILNEKRELIDKIQNNQDIIIFMKVQFNKNCNDPIIGFFIKDIKGNEILGTNTKFSKKDIGFRTKNDIVVVEFFQKIPLTKGVYSLCLGCSEILQDSIVAYHRLYEVIVFEVLSDVEFVGIVNPNSGIRIINNKDIKN